MSTTREMETLKVILTPAEIKALGELMAKSDRDLDEAKEELKGIKAQYAAKIAGLEGLRSSCAEKIRTGFEFRQIEVETNYDYETGTVFKVRLDTLEKIETRAMTSRERQQEIRFGGEV